MRLIVTTLAILSISTSAAVSQTSIPKELTDAMAKLSFLEGRWEGSGTLSMGPNQKSTAKVVELGSYKLQGSVFMFEGKGVAKFPDGKERNVHDALGIITYDVVEKQYRMRTYRADGETLEPKIELRDQTIVWRFKDPTRGNNIRFTLSVKDNVWTEVGEVNVNGEQWFPFFEMKLKKAESSTSR